MQNTTFYCLFGKTVQCEIYFQKMGRAQKYSKNLSDPLNNHTAQITIHEHDTVRTSRSF